MDVRVAEKENRKLKKTLKRKTPGVEMPSIDVSNQASSPRKLPAQTSCFIASDFRHVPQLDFGSIEIGQTRTLPLGFLNPSDHGVAHIVVEDVLPKALGSEFYVHAHEAIVVPMQSSATIDVVFTPTKPGRVHAKLHVRLNKRFKLFCTLTATATGTALASSSSSSSSAKRAKVTSTSSSLAASYASTSSTILRKAGKPETSTSQLWKKRRIVFDDQWIPKQEEGFQKWLNFTLLGAHFAEIKDETPLTTDRYYQLRLLAIRRLESKIRQAAHAVYNHSHTDHVLYRLQREITAKRLTIRADRPLHVDVGLQNELMTLLNHYHPLWLTLGLEVVLGLRIVESLGELIHPTSSSSHMPLFLRRLIAERITNDPVLALKHPSLHLGVNRSEAYLAKLRVHTLVKCFMLVYFLDKAHAQRHVDHIALPCLFRPSSTIKSSKQILYDFCQKFLSQEGNVLRHLGNLEYTVAYEQSVLEEMDMQVENLAMDLRDGVRLVRLLETLVPGTVLSPQLRLPAVSRLQKVHNVKVALSFLEEHCQLQLNAVESSCAVTNYQPTTIGPKDIVDGHREKTLALLWKLISHFKISHVVDVALVAAEIDRVKRRWSGLAAQVYATIHDGDIDENNRSIPQLLLEWCRVVCANYHLAIHNFTASFADGKALCLMVHYYHPRLLEKSDMHWTTSDRSDKDRIGHDEFEALLSQERANFALVNAKVKLLGQVPVLVPEFDSNNLPEEKIIMTFVAYLHSRLLGASKEIHAAFTLQHWWVPRFRRLRRAKRDHAARVIQRFWYTTSHNRFAIRCVQRLLYLARKLQAFGRMVVCRSRYLRHRAQMAARSPVRVPIIARELSPVVVASPVRVPPVPVVASQAPVSVPRSTVVYAPLSPTLTAVRAPRSPVVAVYAPRPRSPPMAVIAPPSPPVAVVAPPSPPVAVVTPPSPPRWDEDEATPEGIEVDNNYDFDAAAACIQRAVRAWLADIRASQAAFRRAMEQAQSAVRLQQWWRAYRRVSFTKALWHRMTFHLRSLRDAAAVTLQRAVRRRQTQAFWYALVYYARLQRRQVAAATRIQRWLRTKSTQKVQHLWSTMVVLLRQKEQAAATRLQRWCRRRFEMAALYRIQATWYALANALLEQQHDAATTLQLWYRKAMLLHVRKQRWVDVILAAHYQRCNHAAVVIQTTWRHAKRRANVAVWHNLVSHVLERHRHELWDAYTSAAATRLQRAFRRYRAVCVRSRWTALAVAAKHAQETTSVAAAVRLQTWWRHYAHTWAHKKWWLDAVAVLTYHDHAARVIQEAWYKACRRSQVRDWFLNVIAAVRELQTTDAAAIVVQRAWRKTVLRAAWHTLVADVYRANQAALLVQTAWRTSQRQYLVRVWWTDTITSLRAQRGAREREAATTLQAMWREYKRRTILRSWWTHIITLLYEQRDAMVVQRQHETKLMQHQAAKTLQTWWLEVQRRSRVRAYWTQLVLVLEEQRDGAAYTLQSWWRTLQSNRRLKTMQDEWHSLAVCLSIQQQDAQSLSATRIQDFVRRYQSLQFLKNWWLGLIEHVQYRESAARIIQAWWAHARMRKQQPKPRRISMHRVLPSEAILKLQAWWRGTLVRRQYDRLSPVTAVRHRLDAAKTSANVVAAALRDQKPLFVQEEKIKLRLRLKRALAILHTSPRLQDMLHAVHTLEMCTRLSRECCVECLLHQVPRLLYAAIRKCNRSRPQLELLHQLLQVVLNLCLHQQGRFHAANIAIAEDVEGHAMSCELWIDLMQMHRDSAVLFTLNARLLKYALMCLVRDNVEFDGRQHTLLSEAHRRLSLLHALFAKRARTKSIVDKQIAHKNKELPGQLHPTRAISILQTLLALLPASAH
ncbi:hypothetical protein SDRG_14652 [Saprolegnia diclina VS20]|uniref:Calponin-homology (CH) domain-containing protein n=1 Tax=Saprolegnia diclina (strain VS20) TaxID=1156394 RepID=T0PQ48_SAPDV|nr:hypothetical protein SDRG_14652 [Saprolegnia diclina VS20]EQC27599.1 hypothetical protein SDRG_14652 [Saprolegnia diclina VS20]|eukprot:XP_008619019.1 hypothetical protein SDRG_14652 [Saprolegnia diclina VS20]